MMMNSNNSSTFCFVASGICCCTLLLAVVTFASGSAAQFSPTIETRDGDIVMHANEDVIVEYESKAVPPVSISGLVDRVAKLEEFMLRTTENDIPELQMSVKDVILPEIAGLSNELDNYEKDIASLQTTVNSNSARINANANRLSRISALDAELVALSKRVTTNAAAAAAAAAAAKSARDSIEKPFVMFSTRSPGTYQLRSIIDGHRNAGKLSHGTYRCLIYTSNGAHWRGVTFTLIANYYTVKRHSGFPHRIFDYTRLDAGSSGGCSAGMYDFQVTGATGYFRFHPGNCHQSLTVACRDFLG